LISAEVKPLPCGSVLCSAQPRTASSRAQSHALLGLEVVLPDGQAPARFGGENMKDVAGYDTKRLFIGSHNAFGTISTAIFKIIVNT
jgi:FAD/FMN-containing dehydrogenase